MSVKFFLVLACAMFAVAAARTVRDVAAQSDPIQEIFDTAKTNLNGLEKTFQDMFGVKSTEELQEKTIAHGKEVAAKFDTWAEDIKKETENLKDHKAVQQLRDTVNGFIEQFKTSNPDTAATIKENVEKANQGAQSIVAKLKELGESTEMKNIKDLSMKLLDNAADTFKSITNKVQEDAKKD